MEQFQEHIKTGTFAQVYVFFGEEDYLRRQYKDSLSAALLGEDSPMNVHVYAGKNPPVGEIIDLAETMPFLAERRILILEETGLFKSGGEELAEYLASPAPAAFFIFTEKEVDKRSKLWKAVSKIGCVTECGMQDEDTLRRWVMGFLKREGKKMTSEDLNLFLEMAGESMDNIRSELEKLLCYCMDKDEIRTEDIEAVCTRQVTGKIFAMIDAIADKKQAKAMELYRDLLMLKEPPMRILYLLGRQFNLLLQVQDLKRRGCGSQVIAQTVGLRDFVVKKYLSQSARFSAQTLRQAVEDCTETEEAVKTGRLNDVLGVELLLARYSGQAQAS